MKSTLISIVRSSPESKSKFGTLFSNWSGIPVFDLDKYKSKYTSSGSIGEQKALNELISDISKQKIAILDNSNPAEALKVSAGFADKAVVFSHSKDDRLTHNYLGKLSPNIGINNLSSNTTYTTQVKINAETINKMNPKFVLAEYGCVASENIMAQLENKLIQYKMFDGELRQWGDVTLRSKIK